MEVIVATPLRSSSVSRPYTFGDGISIRELSPIRWDVAIAKTFLSEHEREVLAATQYWLVAAQEYEHVYGSVGEELYDRARAAAMALQIICPTGAVHTFLKFQHTQDGWDNIGSLQPKQLCSTLLGRITNLEAQGLGRFDAIYQGIRRATQEHLVRFHNPVLLLEHGQQIGNPSLGNLLFVMGLDVLFMAGENRVFVERLGGFLGLDTLVFPPGGFQNRQPATMVRDILSHVYELRNIIAHGQEIPRTPYREPYGLKSTTGEQINHQPLVYADFLLEASLFLLTGALRKLFTDGLYPVVADPKRWKAELQIFEHRFKNAGGIAPPKRARR